MNAMIQVHIERLLLEGLPLAGPEAALLRSTLESELAALLAAHPLDRAPPEWRAGPDAAGQDAAGQDARALGRQAARSVYQSVRDKFQIPNP